MQVALDFFYYIKPKRGRSSANATSAKVLRVQQQPNVPKDLIRFDAVGHWTYVDNKEQRKRCKNCLKKCFKVRQI